MEEQECEVLWMSEALKKRKRDELRLLEFIEKGINYQPTEINTNEKEKLFKLNKTSKVVKGKIFEKQSSFDSLKTVNYQPTKMNTNEREKLLVNYLQNLAVKRRNVLGFLKNNFKVGITEFFSHNEGFSAKMCKLNANFQAKEMQFVTAENKGERSIASQFVIQDKDKESIGCLTSQHLELGELKSNHFNIVLRKVKDDQCHIKTCIKSLEDVGFLNYFESRIFGLLGDQHLIGKQMILERWQEAIDLILEKRFVSKRPSDFALACFEYKSSRDFNKALGMIAENQMSYPAAKLLSSLKLHGGNLAKAVITAVPLDSRLSYVHAYQCFIWNQIVSKRIAKFGSKLIVGDLVYAPRNNNNEKDNQREVIFIDDGNIHEYTIYDVVLPLPTHDSIYPANEVAGWYIDLFQTDGISEKDFNLKSKTYGLGGAYRPMIVRPSDLKWKFVRYDNDNQKLITSDLDRLQQIGLPPVSLQGGSGKYLGLVLEFNLPAFAFASMALREILKMGPNDATINALKENQLCPSQERPSSLASHEVITNEAQIKETEENSCRVTEEPLLETNNFFIDSRPASATSELFQSSSLRKINLESGTVEKQPSRNNLTEQPTCSSSNNESHLKGITFGDPDTIENQPPATQKPFEELQVKKEPGATKRPAPIAKDSSEELHKKQIVLERSTPNQMPQLTVNEGMKEPQTKCVKEEPGISRTRKSTFNESFQEPAEKKIKADPDAKEFISKVSNFKSIIYIDLSSDEED